MALTISRLAESEIPKLRQLLNYFLSWMADDYIIRMAEFVFSIFYLGQDVSPETKI
jgi:hypothetical protein